mgnify:CR=1 FL=1
MKKKAYLLTNLKKDVKVIIPNSYPNFLSWLPNIENVINGKDLDKVKIGYIDLNTNKKYDVKWPEDLEKFKLEKSINWELAIVKSVNDTKIEIETKSRFH